MSNETAWGTIQWNRILTEIGAPRIVTMQNEYSLLCRQYDTDLAEMSVHEDLTLLAYSPLATGILTGKYQGGVVPEGSRMSRGENLSGRATDNAFAAVDAYQTVADAHGISIVHMAIAWILSRPFASIPIIGATSTEQLGQILGAETTVLSDELLSDIARVHAKHAMPF